MADENPGLIPRTSDPANPGKPAHHHHQFRHPQWPPIRWSSALWWWLAELLLVIGALVRKWLRPYTGDINRLVSLSTNTRIPLPLCHRNSPTTHPLVTLSSHSGKKILVKLIFFLTFTLIKGCVLLNFVSLPLHIDKRTVHFLSFPRSCWQNLLESIRILLGPADEYLKGDVSHSVDLCWGHKVSSL